MKKAIIWVDGAARGNPGPAAISAVLKDEKGKAHSRFSQRIGIATNNEAEYRAVIAGIEKAISLGADAVEINSDSELIVRQLSGKYRVKNTVLKPLYERVKQLQSSLVSFKLSHIPREQNREADRLVNKALDSPLTN
jgi:ribonuclease HI